ncbi:MAG: ParD-like family protein [Proteobacteria bacterium]|jgi:hypothetical protein|nr:ParD-like family protein [Pseudomonadota bacterium]
MSFHSIKIEDSFYTTAKLHANAEHRTISSQIGYWAKIGKIALENPDLPVSFIKDILIAKHLKDEAELFIFKNE